MIRVCCRADAAGLGDPVERTPQTAVIAEIEQRSGGLRNGCKRVLRGSDLCGSVAAVERIGGVAPDAGTCPGSECAAVEVHCPGEEQRTACRSRRCGEREIIRALCDGSAAHLQRAVVDAVGEGWRGRGAVAAGGVAQVLPQALIKIVGVNGERVEVAGCGLHGKRTAEDGAVCTATAACRERGAVGSGEVRARLRGEPRPVGAVGGCVVTVAAHGGEELGAKGVPHHGGCGVAHLPCA